MDFRGFCYDISGIYLNVVKNYMNYQFKNGGGTWDTLKLLYKEGGIPRFYRGYLFALMNGLFLDLETRQ